MRRARSFLVLLVAVACFAPTTQARAEISDVDVKAAFLPRFARYITWPAPALPGRGDPFVLCVIGTDPFGERLDTAARSQTVDGRRIIVRRLDSTNGAGACQIAFVAGSRTQSVAQLLAQLGGRPILTVTDSKFGDSRGMIHFAISGGRVRFFIDQGDAQRCGLTISSRLLALAIGVRQR